jgi:hypothetical protein
VDRETTEAMKQVEDAEPVIDQKQEDMWHAEEKELTTRKHKKTFGEILNTMWDSLSDLASSDNEEDEEDKGYGLENTELGTWSEDDKPGWVLSQLTKTL